MVCPKCKQGNIRVATDTRVKINGIMMHTAFCDTCTQTYNIACDAKLPELKPNEETMAQVWRKLDVEYDVRAAMELLRKEYPLLSDHLDAKNS